MHSQGLSYWCHSLQQVLFLLQCNLFVKLNSKWKYGMFLFLSIIIPYVEWTGYISNFGFILALLVEDTFSYNNKKLSFSRKRILFIISIGICTIISFVVFCLHFISVVDSTEFFNAIKTRFLVRSYLSNISIGQLILGYVQSYKYILIFELLVLLLVLIYKETRNKFVNFISKNKSLCIIIFFPLLENIVMMGHATVYNAC